jgi:hypothetical protein
LRIDPSQFWRPAIPGLLSAAQHGVLFLKTSADYQSQEAAKFGKLAWTFKCHHQVNGAVEHFECARTGVKHHPKVSSNRTPTPAASFAIRELEVFDFTQAEIDEPDSRSRRWPVTSHRHVTKFPSSTCLDRNSTDRRIDIAIAEIQTAVTTRAFAANTLAIDRVFTDASGW